VFKIKTNLQHRGAKVAKAKGLLQHPQYTKLSHDTNQKDYTPVLCQNFVVQVE
jgi:hypothetical protein